ncbi:MAG: serine/threonine protein kinase [Rhodobacteraceae bacterium]|nr:serine/threonine protein kinase [Paracoccaceae bacterium]
MQHNTCHNTEEFPDELPSGTLLLHGQYQIERYLIRGGFGITYLARDSLDRRVVIKECFPHMVCCRMHGLVQAKRREQQDQFDSLLRHFLREARRLAHLSHPNIVGVHQVFEENSTAYMALDHVDGMDLLSVVEEDPGRLTPDVIRDMLTKALGAISYVHSESILHRDISPDNILLDKLGNLTLIDFGAAKEHASREGRALSSLLAVKDGYSPQEFYLRDITQGPSSDLYALGATFYHLITGQAPPDSQQRLAAVAAGANDPFAPLDAETGDYTGEFLDTINKALEIFPEDRIQTADDWIEIIDPERRKQAALARAGKDKTIRVKISKLVADTNRNLRKAAKPGPKKRQGPARANGPGDPAAKQAPVDAGKSPTKPVDIFGNPIENVEAWLWDQDRIAESQPPPNRRQPRVKAMPVLRTLPDIHYPPAPEAEMPKPLPPIGRPLRPTLLRSLIGRLVAVGFYPPKPH